MQFQIGEYNQYLEEKTNELSEIHALLDQNATKRKQTEVPFVFCDHCRVNWNHSTAKRRVVTSRSKCVSSELKMNENMFRVYLLHTLHRRCPVHASVPDWGWSHHVHAQLSRHSDSVRCSSVMSRSAKVNSYLHDLAHQDSIWRRLFRIDSRKRLAVALQNNWLLQKWRLYNPNVPVSKWFVCSSQHAR